MFKALYTICLALLAAPDWGDGLSNAVWRPPALLPPSEEKVELSRPSLWSITPYDGSEALLKSSSDSMWQPPALLPTTSYEKADAPSSWQYDRGEALLKTSSDSTWQPPALLPTTFDESVTQPPWLLPLLSYDWGDDAYGSSQMVWDFHVSPFNWRVIPESLKEATISLSAIDDFLPSNPLEWKTVKETVPNQGSAAVPAPVLQSLMLFGSMELAQSSIDQPVDGVSMHELDLPGSEQELADLLYSYLDEPISMESIKSIKIEIAHYYRSKSHPVVAVLTPEQDITEGQLKLAVVEGHVGEVKAKGQRYFSGNQMVNATHLKSGDLIDTADLLSDVTWLNQNPFRNTNIIFTPGKEPWTTDIELITQDRMPFRLYGGVDNTGNPLTGLARWFAGFNWGNAFNLGHLMSLQYTTSSDFHEFKAISGSYTIPFTWHHTLTFYGGYAQVNPDIPGLISLGKSAQVSSRYKIPIGREYGVFLQNMQFGYDFKTTNNNLMFADNPSEAIETKTVDLGQFAAGYHLSYIPHQHVVNFDANIYISPFSNVYKNQTSQAYNLLQPGANPHYGYVYFMVNEQYTFTDQKWKLFAQGRLQVADSILLPSEQFGLGGYSTVRGYQERIVNYDDAVCLNFEIATPAGHLLHPCKQRFLPDELYGLFFVDYGWGRPFKKEQPVNHELDPTDQTLFSVGFGFRYKLSAYLLTRFDLGFPLTEVQGESQHPRIHFGVFLSY